MNVIQLVDALLENPECPPLGKGKLNQLVRLMLDTLYEGAMKDGAVRIGKHRFTVRRRSARMGRNIRTGEPLEIPAKTVVVYDYRG